MKTLEEDVQPEVKRVKRIALKTPEGEVQAEEITKRSRTTYTTKQRDSLKQEIEVIIEKQKSLKPYDQKNIKQICLEHNVSLSVFSRWRK